MKIKKDNIEISSPKAVVFARVSSREQEQGQSIEAQLENIYRYCKRKEIQILKEYKITESSTRGERKKFNEMLNFVKTQKNKVLIISECVDRIQRSFKESISLDELMQKDKIELHFVRECLILSKESDTTDISRWDFSVMAAKTYVGNLRDNVNRSMRYILEHGRWQHYAPLGYMNVRDASGQADIVLDPERAPLIKYLFEEYATGNYSLRSLADLANEIGLTARRSKNKTICKNSVFTFLKNPFYYGIMVEKNKYYEHHHEKLIDKSLFDKVQEVLAGRKVSPTKMTYRGREFATRGKESRLSFAPDITDLKITVDKGGKIHIRGNSKDGKQHIDFTYLNGKNHIEITTENDASSYSDVNGHWVRRDLRSPSGTRYFDDNGASYKNELCTILHKVRKLEKDMPQSKSEISITGGLQKMCSR